MGAVYTLGHTNRLDSPDQTPLGVRPTNSTLELGVWVLRKWMMPSILCAAPLLIIVASAGGLVNQEVPMLTQSNNHV